MSEIASNSKDNPIVLENKPTSEVGQLIEYKHNQDETFPIENFLLAFFITIIIEIFVAAIYFLIKKISLFSLRWIFYANFITVPLFWFLAYKYNFSITPYFIGELIIVLFEAVFIKTFIKQLRWQDALILSIAMNIASYFIGNILIFVLGAQFWQ